MPRILIAEDEASNRLLLKEALEMHDYEVVAAQDGVEAMEAFSAQAVDLLITDMLMPRKPGIDLIREIRRSNPDIRIVAMAAMGEAVLIDARDAGADRTIQKPYHLTELLAVVDELLR